MSHFVVNLIISKELCPEKEDITSDVIDGYMFPYSENLEVEEYEEDCHCIGSDARRESTEKATKHMGKSLNEFRSEYLELPEEGRVTWDEFIEPLKEVEKMFYKNHPLKDSPDEDCYSCSGTGVYTTTYNPDSKWDWYVTGGRWHGWLTDTEPVLDPYQDDILSNTVSTEENLISRKIPFAALTPDGEWHEKGEMYMFGMSNDAYSKEDWEAYYLKLLEEHPDHWVVAVDCHI